MNLPLYFLDDRGCLADACGGLPDGSDCLADGCGTVDKNRRDVEVKILLILYLRK